MIFTERTITVVNDSATINKPLILYRGDKNIELKITIVESQFKFRSTGASNVIETANASYAQLVINTPYNSPIFSEVTATENGTVIFVISAAMIDEVREVGIYDIQIRLLDDNKQSRVTIPPVSNAIEIREPMAIEDGSPIDSNVVNVAKVNRALTTTSAPLEAFDSQGNYIKKTWGDGDPITDAALNKLEAGIDGVNKKVANNSSQIKDIINNGTGGIVSNIEPMNDDMPKVFFNGDKPTTKDSVYATIEYISKTEHFKGYVDIKCQGTSSMSYSKKNYTIKMFTDETMATKLKKDFKGWGKQSKFCLKANYIDHSHARNIVSAKLWGQVVKSRSDFDTLPEELKTSPNYGAVDGFPIKVYYNGTYEGVYTWNIPKDGWMNNMDDKLDTHCILCGEEYDSGCFRSANASLWSDELHDVMPANIVTSFNNFQNFVINSSDDEFKTGLSTYADVNSLIDYYIFQYAICGLDSMGKNQLFFTYDGIKWIASAYDMDSTFGLYWNGQSFVSATYRMQEDYESMTDGRQGNLLYIRLEQLFRNEIKARYAELRAGVLSYANIVNEFEKFMDVIGKDLYAEDLTIYTEIPSGDTNNIQQIRNYTRDRLTYVDTQIEALAGPVEPIPCTSISLNKTELALLPEAVTKNYLDGIVSTTNGNDTYFENITLSTGDYVFTNIDGGTFTWLNYSIDEVSDNSNKDTTAPAYITVSGQSANVTVHGFPGNNPVNNTPDKLALYKIVASEEVEGGESYTFEQAGTGYYNENGNIVDDANNVYSNTLTLDSNKKYALKYIGASTADPNNLVMKTSSGVVYASKIVNTNDNIQIIGDVTSLSISVNTVTNPMSLSDIVLKECNIVYEKVSTIKQETLIATVEPSDTTDTVTWSVEPTGIATVNNGVVTPVANGECTITATCGTQSANCNVTVSGMSESGGDTGDYTDIEYIESTGTQYINTHIVPTASTKIELVAEISASKTYDHIFGSDIFMKTQWVDNTGTAIFATKKNGQNQVSGLTLGKHTYIMDMTDTANVITIDGTKYGNIIGQVESTTNSLLLLSGYNNDGTVETEFCGVGKIYSCKIYYEDTLVANMKPILTNSGTYGLLDTVNNTFYASEVGSFTGPVPK